MKWARIKPGKKGGSTTAQDQENDQACYKDFRDTNHLNKTFDHKKSLWAEHPFEYDFKTDEDFLKFQKRYEIFCGGYLYYYDKIIRSNRTDHTLYFKWKGSVKKGKFAVGIYLHPAPLRAKADRPAWKLISKIAAKQNGQLNGNGKLLKTESSTGNGSTDLAIDPPAPPPPPPPSMHE